MNSSHDVQGLSTPVGFVAVIAEGDLLREVLLTADEEAARYEIRRKYPSASWGKEVSALRACDQLREFFLGERGFFDLTLDWSCFSPFATAVLRELTKIPLGTTLTYGELAQCAGFPGRARAVGRVMAGNPYPIVLPCHRVVGRDGRLTGYSGGDGIQTKSRLLEFEASINKNPQLFRKTP
ncbi:methylated-DNA--[protein]-cysteine S-methyltransferase [Trichloromonas sp.]|uniref:methylated-DNA--[protein]-cysteine S-methyltransferase n=1 Tax=Trichloromonas sp. TaxID=3069249 RepID=UPI002A3BF6C7|nr:methylated-DNA--[protein]-cysteine S-methyltransferase [Trichloromonas sp.]